MTILAIVLIAFASFIVIAKVGGYIGAYLRARRGEGGGHSNIHFASLLFCALAGCVRPGISIVVQRVSRIVDNLYYILGMELMHAAQAVDLRKMLKSPDLKLGRATEALYGSYRAEVPFLAEDRTLTFDIQTSYEFAKHRARDGLRHRFELSIPRHEAGSTPALALR